MLPAVSAEDCLFADLGIDPSFPGLQTLEATDMLLRKRKLLTDTHVIIWQVGCVGDLGFRRQGYLNHNFHVLIKYLQEAYGEEYVITHYVGAQFPMCSALIERIPLNGFMENDVAKRVTGISTFYIPPRDAKAVDPAMAVKLGLVKNTEDAKKFPNNTVRPVANYGPRETKAIADLDHWVVPHPYVHTPLTKAARYVASLATNIQLLRTHVQQPEKSMKASSLGQYEMVALQSKHSGRIRMALKANMLSIAQQVVIRLVTVPKFAALFNTKMKQYMNDANAAEEMHKWLLQEGYDITLDDILHAKAELQKSSLIMWSGKYSSSIANVNIIIQGAAPPLTGNVLVEGVLVKKLTFANSTLSWSSKDGNHSSASLVFTAKESDVFAFTGKYWEGDNEPSSDNISGHSVSVDPTLSNLVGRYKTNSNSAAGPEVVVAAADSASKEGFSIQVGGSSVVGFKFDGAKNQLSWTDSSNSTNAILTFKTTPAQDKKSTGLHFLGMYWKKGEKQPVKDNFFGSIDKAYIKPYVGQYKTTMKSSDGKFSSGLEFYVSVNKAGSVQLTTGGTVIQKVTFNNPTLQWTSESGNPSNGAITLYINSSTNKPGFTGVFWMKGAQKPAANNIFGTFDSKYLEPWSAYYSTSLLPTNKGGETEPGPMIQVVGTTSPLGTVVMYGTIAIKKPQFNNPVLCWSMDDGNVSSAELTLFNKNGRRLSGYVWFEKGSKPPKPNIIGFIDPKYLQSWTGTYYMSTKQPNGTYKPSDTEVIIKGGKTEKDSSVHVGKDEIKNWSYSKNQLSWTDADNDSNGEVNLYISKDKYQSFSGSYSKKGGTKSSVIGSTKQPPKSASSTSSVAAFVTLYRKRALVAQITQIELLVPLECAF